MKKPPGLPSRTDFNSHSTCGAHHGRPAYRRRFCSFNSHSTHGAHQPSSNSRHPYRLRFQLSLRTRSTSSGRLPLQCPPSFQLSLRTRNASLIAGHRVVLTSISTLTPHVRCIQPSHPAHNQSQPNLFVSTLSPHTWNTSIKLVQPLLMGVVSTLTPHAKRISSIA